MKIGALLSKDSIRLNGKASGKKAVIDAMVLLMEKGNHLRDAGAIRKPYLTERLRDLQASVTAWRFPMQKRMQ